MFLACSPVLACRAMVSCWRIRHSPGGPGWVWRSFCLSAPCFAPVMDNSPLLVPGSTCALIVASGSCRCRVVGSPPAGLVYLKIKSDRVWLAACVPQGCGGHLQPAGLLWHSPQLPLPIWCHLAFPFWLEYHPPVLFRRRGAPSRMRSSSGSGVVILFLVCVRSTSNSGWALPLSESSFREFG